MLKGVSRQEATVYELPGRDWHLCIGSQNSTSQEPEVGVAVFSKDQPQR